MRRAKSFQECSQLKRVDTSDTVSFITVQIASNKSTMKAYQWDGPGHSELVLRDLPIPKVKSGSVLIQVKACGLCHSDLHVLDGSGADWAGYHPITLGHEIAGIITELGEGVNSFSVGQRVVLALIPPDLVVGVAYNGGFAEFVVAPEETLVALPDELEFGQACITVDAIATAYRAVVSTAEVKKGMVVAIVGLGGLGSVALQVASLQGATVYGYDIDQSKHSSAIEDGARSCFEKLEDTPKDVRFDVIIDFVGIEATINTAIDMIDPFKNIVLVGLGQQEVKMKATKIVMKNLDIRGSLGGSKEDLPKIFDLLLDGKIVTPVEEVSFSRLSEALDRLEQGQVSRRMYVRPDIA